MYPALSCPRSDDLAPFSRLLWQQGISHLVQRVDDRQVLLVADKQRIAEAQGLFQRWRDGELLPGETDSSAVSPWLRPGDWLRSLGLAFMRVPLSLLTVAVCCLLAVLTLTLGHVALFEALLYPDLGQGRPLTFEQWWQRVEWRHAFGLFSPALLHGGYVHLAFNMLWFWEFARRIEYRQSTWMLAGAMLLMGITSNTAQYLLGGGNNFVGLSGVVYGLLAYIWMWQLFDPREGLNLPVGLIVVMVLSLVLLSLSGLSMIAHEAHIAGLLSGVVLGAVLATLSSVRRRQAPIK